MNILITGVHGFVGSNLVKYLAKENTIYGLDIVQPQKDGVMCTFSWDALDVENGLPEIDAIIHLAGMAKKFVFFSTAQRAADRLKGEFLTEECVPTPVGPYGESKIKAEDYIIKKFAPKALKRPFHNFDDSDSIVSDKQVYIIRPCMIHGPGNKGNLNMLYGVVKKGIPWPLGAFENRRSFTSIGNLCVVIEGLLTKSVPSGIYHMGDDEALSTNELIEVICEAIGKKAHIWRIPKGLMNGVAKVGGWLHLPLNPLRMQKLTENYVVSNKKIKSALGIDAMPIRAKDGLIDTIRSFGK